jgi:hypothetical protein
MQAEFIKLSASDQEKYLSHKLLYLPSEVLVANTRDYQNQLLEGTANPLPTFSTSQLRSEFMSLSTNDKEDYLAHRMQSLPSQIGNVFGDESIQDRSRIRISQSTRDSNSQST